MPKLTKENWRWNKPMRWADLCRADRLLYGTRGTRQRLARRIRDKKVKQIGYGLYQAR
jgi:hypothetical protein